jgi:hypothetical protein
MRSRVAIELRHCQPIGADFRSLIAASPLIISIVPIQAIIQKSNHDFLPFS